MTAPEPILTRATAGFSLAELLVVIAVIAVITGVALPAIANVRESARDTVVQHQEQLINNVYRTVKAVRPTMPTTQAEILEILASDPRAKIEPPQTIEGSGGTLTLVFDTSSDRFTYVSPDDPLSGI